jgi:hypothetical protein
MARRASPTNANKRRRLSVEQKLERARHEATGTNRSEIALARLDEVTRTMRWDGEEVSEKVGKFLNLLETMKELAPRDGFERMLANQMMAVHHATIECFRRAMVGGQTFEQRDSNLKHAEKLSATYAMQLDTLNKHRGKGQQKVTVEHVNVAAGGQAIVGNVDPRPAAATRSRRRKVPPPQLEHQTTVTPPVDAPEEPSVRVRVRRKPEHG